MTGRDPADGDRPDKGKGKSTTHDDSASSAPQDESTSSSSAAANDGSVFSRITQSAAGLGRGLLNTRPGGGELAALSSAAAGSKGAPAFGAGGASASGSAQEPAAARIQGNGHTAPAPAMLSGGFRSHAHEHAEAQEQAFSQFLDGTSIDLSMPEQPRAGADLSAAEDAWTRAQPAQPAQPAQIQPSALTDVAAQESRDGFDVVNLLSAAGPPEEEPNYSDIEPAEHEVAALKRALFGDSSSSSSSSSSSGQPLTAVREWDNVLNFIPDFVRPHPAGGYDGDADADADAASASIKSHETRAALGMPHSSETTRVWLDQWHDVLTRYDDEVWGGLSPLVVQAREEVDQLKETADEPPQPASTKALDRLRQILGHLRANE